MSLVTMDGRLTLKDLCSEKIVNNILLSTVHKKSREAEIRMVCIPLGLSQEIFDICFERSRTDEVNDILNFFLKNPTCTPLRQICLQNAHLADVILIYRLVKANLETLTHLDVRGCRILPKKFWALLHIASKLTHLKTTNLLAPFRCPNLEVLVVDWEPKTFMEKLQQHFQSMYYDKLLENVMGNLKHLDLSWCPWVKRLKTIGNATALEKLMLRNCDISNIVDDISQLTELRLLDISVGLEQELNHGFNGQYSNPNYILRQIVTALTKLEHLDISGTNLTLVSDNTHSTFSVRTRPSTPLKFLGLYSTNWPENNRVQELPALIVAGSENPESLIESIKRNIDMPKTLRHQIAKLLLLSGPSVDFNMLFEIQIKMLKNLRANEHFRFWALKCLCTFFDQLENPIEQTSREARRELFHVLNRLNRSHIEFDKNSELSIRFTFRIFLKLLSIGEMKSKEDCHELVHLGKFLLSANRTNFVYFKTEALLFRLLYKLSLEPYVCFYLSEDNVVPSCFEFFKTIQVYLGFSLRVPQTSEIVEITWTCILNFMQVSQNAVHDFIKYKGLSWMYAHLSWFSYDERTQQELRNIFISILNILDTFVAERKEHVEGVFKQRVRLPKELMSKVKNMIHNREST